MWKAHDARLDRLFAVKMLLRGGLAVRVSRSAVIPSRVS